MNNPEYIFESEEKIDYDYKDFEDDWMFAPYKNGDEFISFVSDERYVPEYIGQLVLIGNKIYKVDMIDYPSYPAWDENGIDKTSVTLKFYKDKE